MSLSQRIYGRISPRLAHRGLSTRIATGHAKLIARTNGKLGTRFFGGAPLLVLRTVGRKTGQVRESPAIYVKAGPNAWAVTASNAASQRFPAWYHNLHANPDIEVLVEGRWRAVRARKAEGQEAEELTARIEAIYEGAKHYAAITTRELPIVVLEPRD
jgi:deazaflavin-dependent oxidoreductase (nitroreductase family)